MGGEDIAETEGIQTDKVHGEGVEVQQGPRGLCGAVHTVPETHQGHMGRQAV